MKKAANPKVIEVYFQSTFDGYDCALVICSASAMNKRVGGRTLTSKMKSATLFGKSFGSDIWLPGFRDRSSFAAFAGELVRATSIRFETNGMMNDKFNEEAFAYSVGELGANLLRLYNEKVEGKPCPDEQTEAKGQLIQLPYKSKVDKVTVLLNVGDRQRMNDEVLNGMMITGQGGATARADGDDKIFIWLPDWQFRVNDFGMLFHELIHASMHRVTIRGKRDGFRIEDIADSVEELTEGLLRVLEDATQKV